MSTGYHLDLSHSFQYHADRETVTLKDGLGNAVGTVPDAKRLGGVDAEKSPSHVKYLEWQSSWRLPQPNVTGQIAPGWTITDIDGLVWTVLEVAYPRNQNQAWQCFANRLLFSVPMKDTIQYIQASVEGASGTGARTVTDTPIGSPVAAAIESESNLMGEQFGTINMSETYLIYLDSDPSGTGPSVIKPGDLLKDQNNTIYEIESVATRNRLDLKPTVRAVKKL